VFDLFHNYYFYSYEYSLTNNTSGFGNSIQKSKNVFHLKDAIDFTNSSNEERYKSKSNAVILSFQKISKKQFNEIKEGAQ